MTTINALSILGTAAGGPNAPAAPTVQLTVLGYAAQLSLENQTNSGGVFGALAGAATDSAIQNILANQQTAQTRTSVYDNIANYLSALQSGQLTPSTTWQTNAAYLQQTGQAFVVTLDSTGQPQITPESQADLSRYTPAEQRILGTALAALSTMAQKIQANTTNASWLNELNNIEPALVAFKNGAAAPDQGWQTQAADLAADGVPFKVGLDASGNIIVENQFQSDFPDATLTDQPKLAAAAAQLRTALQTGVTPLAWEAQALTYAKQGQDYFLSVDQVTGNIVVDTNTPANIVPAFLQTPPYPDIGADTPWLQNAASLITSGTGFYLDVGNNGQVIVRQNNGQGINTFNQPRQQALQNPIINLLA